TPMEGAALDLNTVLFAWAETPGAKRYTISIWYEEKIVGGVRGNEAWSKKVETTRFALADLPATDKAKFTPLKAGVKGTFHVTADDAKGRQVGGSRRSFVGTQPLAGK